MKSSAAAGRHRTSFTGCTAAAHNRDLPVAALVAEVRELQRHAEVVLTHRRIAFCRSSRFFPVTRSWSAWTWCCTPLRPRPLMYLPISRAFSSVMPTWSATVWRAVPSRLLRPCRSRAPSARPCGEPSSPRAPARGLQPFLRRRLDLDRVVLELEFAVGALEVEACRDSRSAWSIALRTSCTSTSETTSKLGIAHYSSRQPVNGR